MAELSERQKGWLRERFGDRVTFDPTERVLYGHDIAEIPGLVKPLVGDTRPRAVVQPADEAEVADLVRWAVAEGLPLTPRGKATSGYGGAVPVGQGIVVDFFRMRRVVEVDAQEQTVTVEPGITWERLDRALGAHGLTLRLYPTSYPSSTVGGWLAQGGVGIGSYAYGPFPENVVAARVVTPDGRVREFAGDDLALVADAEGITGLITRVTLRVRPAEPLAVAAAAFDDADGLQRFLETLAGTDLPVWSVTFINPRMAELKARAPRAEHEPAPPALPRAFVVTLAFPEHGADDTRNGLGRLAAAAGGRLLPHEVARHEWDHRFEVMVVKRLGPSLVPSEVVVPLDRLAAFLGDVEAKVGQPIVKEGLVVRRGRDGRPEVVILGFIPADRREFSYHFVFGLSLTVLRAAEALGGRAYATGLFFADRAREVLGPDRLERLRAFKREVDPRGLLNPRKVLDNGILGTALGLAGRLEPVARKMGNAVHLDLGERPSGGEIKGIPADVAWYAYACSQCGYCVDECDQFYGRGWESQSPRGKWYWLREYLEGRARWDQRMVDTVLSCTTCEMCEHRCPEHLPVERSWMKLRGKLIHDQGRMTFPPFEMMAAALSGQGNIWAGYRRSRSDWFPADLREAHGPGRKAKAVYFAGCTASYVERDIGIASVRLLHDAGVDFTYLGEEENCCATPMLVAGKWDLFAETLRKNVEAVKRTGADTVITSCPACDMMWRKVYPEWARKLGIDYGITARHYSEVVAERIRDGRFRFPERPGGPVTVTWHDSCHMGRASKVYEAPREVIRAIPGVEFVEMPYNRDEAHCCGSVLTLIKEPEVAADLGKVRLDEAVEVGAAKVLAACPCCQFQLRVAAERRNVPVEVVDLAHFAAEALGHELPDPHPEVRAQWAVFEKMIALMTPEGFAGLMKTMWPELLEAMPAGMGAMMRAMGRVPGALEAMKPLFPVLFPRLLPLMMPKVLPTLIDRIRERVPMPEYMAEQMPALLPKVMDNLMPHMIGDVVPLVADDLIGYLKGAGREETRRAA